MNFLIILLMLLILLVIVYYLFIDTNDKRINTMVEEFVKINPDKCIICSYHRYGLENGLTFEKTPPEHECIEDKK